MWPERLKLGEDRLAEHVARPGQRVGRVRVQALERPCARLGATDSERELGPEPPLLLVRFLEARRELRILGRACAPTLDAPGRLEPRDRGDERRARQVEGRRERLARIVVGRLLGYRRTPMRAADGHAPECTGRAAQLELDEGAVVHAAIVAARPLWTLVGESARLRTGADVNVRSRQGESRA